MGSFNLRKFLESGGTKTDSGSAIDRFRSEAGLSTSNFKAGSGPESSGNRGGDGGASARAVAEAEARARALAQEQEAKRLADLFAQEQARLRQEQARLKLLKSQRFREKEKRRIMEEEGISLKKAGQTLSFRLRDSLNATKKNIKNLKINEKILNASQKELKQIITEEIIEQTPNMVTAVDIPKGFLEKLLKNINDKRRIIRTKKLRGEGTDIKEETKLVSGAVGSTILSGVIGIKDLVTLPFDKEKREAITENAGSIGDISKKALKMIKTEGKNFGTMLKVSPTEAIAQVGTEILIFKGVGKALTITGKVAGKVAKTLIPILKSKGTKIIFKGTQINKGGKIVTKIQFKTKGLFKKFGEVVGVTTGKGKLGKTKVIGRIFKKTKKGVKKEVFFKSGEVTKAEATKLKKELELLIKKATKGKKTKILTAKQIKALKKKASKILKKKKAKQIKSILKTVKSAKKDISILKKGKLPKKAKSFAKEVKKAKKIRIKKEGKKIKSIKKRLTKSISNLEKEIKRISKGKKTKAEIKQIKALKKVKKNFLKKVKKINIQDIIKGKANKIINKINKKIGIVRRRKQLKKIIKTAKKDIKIFKSGKLLKEGRKAKKIRIKKTKVKIKRKIKLLSKDLKRVIKGKKTKAEIKQIKALKKARKNILKGRKIRFGKIRDIVAKTKKKVKAKVTIKPTSAKARRKLLKKSERIRKKGDIELRIKRVSQQFKVPSKKLKIVKENIKSIKQKSTGKIFLSKVPSKLMKTGKKIRGVTAKQFASFSSILTNKDISLIVGKAITNTKDLVRFKGIIKGIEDVSSLSGVSLKQQKVFKQALDKVLGVASASATTKKILPKLSPTAKASLKKITETTAKTIPASKQVSKIRSSKVGARVSQRTQSKTKTSQQTKQIAKTTTSTKSKLRSSQLFRTKQRQKAKQRQSTKPATKTKTKLAQKTMPKLRTKQKQKIITKKVPKFKKPPTPRITPTPRKILIPIKLKKKKVKPIVKKKRSLIGYDVLVKSKRKFIKVNKKPLSKTQAKDRGAYITDNTITNTYKIVPIGKFKRLGKLTRGESGKFSRSKSKYRGFKLKRKKKIGLSNKYIEKRGRPRIDKKGEKQGLTLNKFLKQKGILKSKKKRRTIKRKGKK